MRQPLDNVQLLGLLGLGDAILAVPARGRTRTRDHEQRPRGNHGVKRKGIKVGHEVPAARQRRVGRARVLRPRRAVVAGQVAERLGEVGRRVLEPLGQHVHDGHLFVAGHVAVAVLGRGLELRVQHLHVGRVLVVAAARHGADADGRRRGHGLDAQVRLRREGHVPARRADAQHTDLVGVDFRRERDEVRDGALDVFDAVRRVLEVARLALRVALVSRVVGQAGEARGGEDARVVGRRLLLDGGPRVGDDDGGAGARGGARGGSVEERGEPQPARVEGDLLGYRHVWLRYMYEREFSRVYAVRLRLFDSALDVAYISGDCSHDITPTICASGA